MLSYIDVNLMCYYLLCLDGNVTSVGILLDLRGIIYVIIPGRQIKYSIIPNVFFFGFFDDPDDVYTSKDIIIFCF